MSLRDDWDSQYTPDLFGELGETVTYTSVTPGSQPVSVTSLFHRDYIHVKVSGGMGVEISKPVFVTRDLEVVNPQAGDIYVFKTISYTVIEVQRTRSGVTVNITDLTSG